jgi:predicted enzyme related to lactoylglutathione lyase
VKLVQVSVTTHNIDRLVIFYKEAFGFFEVSRSEKPDQKLATIKIRRGHVMLELTKTGSIAPRALPFSLHNEGWNMIGLEINDMSKTLLRVAELGGKVIDGPIQGKSVLSIAFIEDVDGNGIELIEPRLTLTKTLTVSDWDRAEFWSTGVIDAELEFFIQNASNYFVEYDVTDELVKKAIQKLGDISGCPIPLKVSEKLGELQAVAFFNSLIADYNFIGKILEQLNMSWKDQWGQEEERPNGEPLGEDGSQVPESVRSKNKVRGPGNYLEFSITRLLWVNKNQPRRELVLNTTEITSLISESTSRVDLQIKLIASAARKYMLAGVSGDVVTREISKGICPAGFFSQNNCYGRIEESRKQLKAAYGTEEWFEALDTEIAHVLRLPLTELS